MTSADAPPYPQLLRLSEVAYTWIRDRLVLLDLRPGEPVNEERIAAELGMGRTPVREALKRLESDRLVVSFPRRGTFTAEINITDLAQIFEVRRQLEPLAAGLAAVRADEPEREQLTRLLGDLEAPSSGRQTFRELMVADLRVHRSLYGATHNPFLEDTLIQYDNLATRIWGVFGPQLSGAGAHIEEHLPLLRAVIGADQHKAARLARQHVIGFEEAVRAVL